MVPSLFCKSWYQERSSTEYCLFCFVEKRCIESSVFYFILFYFILFEYGIGLKTKNILFVILALSAPKLNK